MELLGFLLSSFARMVLPAGPIWLILTKGVLPVLRELSAYNLDIFYVRCELVIVGLSGAPELRTLCLFVIALQEKSYSSPYSIEIGLP